MRKLKTKATDKILLKLYAEGLTYREIGKHTGMTYKQAQARIRTLKKQIKIDEPIRSPEQLQKLRDRIRILRQNGLEMKAIGREIGITSGQVYRHLQAIGLE